MFLSKYGLLFDAPAHKIGIADKRDSRHKRAAKKNERRRRMKTAPGVEETKPESSTIDSGAAGCAQGIGCMNTASV
jgi:hypothetical protein